MRPPRCSTPLLRAFAIACAAVLVSLTPARAQQPAAPAKDTLIFNNGDQLQGTLEKADGDAVTFKSDMAGEITVKLANIKELRSAQSFAVLRKDVSKKEKNPGILGAVSVTDGKVSVARAQGAVETVPSDQLGYIVTAPDYEKAIGSVHAPFANWNGSVTGGATLVRSTQKGTTLTTAISLVRLAPGVPYLPAHSRSTVNVAESYGTFTSPVIPPPAPAIPSNTVKTNIFHADAEYDHYFSPRLYALADLAFDHNFSQGLQLQQIYGGGVGFTVIQQPVQQLDLKGEIHYEKQQFIGVSTQNDLIGAALGENYLRNFPRKIVFTETALFIPAFNNTDAYSADLGLGLSIPAYKRLSISLSANDNYLHNPPPFFRKNSFQFITGVTYTLR